jgi:hypothetical protein
MVEERTDMKSGLTTSERLVAGFRTWTGHFAVTTHSLIEFEVVLDTNSCLSHTDTDSATLFVAAIVRSALFSGDYIGASAHRIYIPSNFTAYSIVYLFLIAKSEY